MKYYSTKNKKELVSLKEAVLKGLPNDGGLYMPVELPKVNSVFLNNLNSMSFQEIAFTIARKLMREDVPEKILKNIVISTFDFKVPLIRLDEQISVLELFHGPTLAFKDFAARFMSRLMEYFVKDSNHELTILTATSGDTGSAVANGFHNMDGIKVIILFPSGMVSALQEKQLTTIGDNITALEIKGTFDDCQKLVKQAFLDPDFSESLNLTSANSINIARLIPQTFYYFYALGNLSIKSLPAVMSVPCGNFGNLTAGLMAKKMGLPVSKFVASVNQNDSFLKYLNTGFFSPVETKKTISNAMDVGNPSNFYRILDLYNNNVDAIRTDITSFSYADYQTRKTIKLVYQENKYILDPHGAVGYLGLQEYLEDNSKKEQGIFLETAHPAKFIDIVQPLVSQKIEIPERLSSYIKEEKKAELLSKEYGGFKEFLNST